MNYKVPELSIIFMAVVALVGIAIPVMLLIFFRKKYKSSLLAFFTGCGVFVVFALLIEGTLHRLILPSDLGQKIQANFWLFAAYGGLMAGLFEETGRFVAFKTLLRKKSGDNRNALMYGAGHGGFEVFYLLTVSMISYISMAVMLNSGMGAKLTAGVHDPATLKTLEATFASLAQTPSATFLMSIVERLAAVTLQISLSVLVWFAAKQKGRFWLFPLAVVLHALIDAVAVIMAKNGINVWIIEGAIYAVAVAGILIAHIVWKKSVSSQADSDIVS